MLVDCDESLPSHSAFIAPKNYPNDSESRMKFNTDKSEDLAQSMIRNKNISSLPPTSLPDIQNSPPYHNNNSYTSNLEINNFNDTAKPTSKPRSPTGTFTFLRKNSRKEPSALNRTSTTSPHSKEIQNIPNNTSRSSTKLNNTNLNTVSQHQTNISKTLDNYTTASTDNNDEIMLSGSSYWGLEETDSYIKGYLSKQQSPQVSKEDILENSTITMVAKQWALQKNDFQQELKEFELIEKQLEINTTTTNNNKLMESKSNNNGHIKQNALEVSYSSSYIGNDKIFPSYQFDNGNQFEMNQSTVSSNYLDSSYPFKTTASINELNDSNIHDFDEFDTTNNYSTSDFSSIPKDNTILSSYSSNILDSQSWGKPTQPNSVIDNKYDHDLIQSSNNYENTMMKTRLSNNTLKKVNSLQQQQQVQRQQPVQYDNDLCINTKEDFVDTPFNQTNKSFHHSIDRDLHNNEDLSNPSHTTTTNNNNNNNSNSNVQDENPWGEDSYLDNDYNSSKQSYYNNNIHNEVDDHYDYKDSEATNISRVAPTLLTTTNSIILTRPVSNQSKATSNNNTRNSRTNNNNSSKTSLKLNPYEYDELQKSLIEKAQALETELDTYKTENINLKKLRKQQENTLSEIISQKEDLYNWIESEKQKTITWCNEQKQLAIKERNQVAKLVRDSRQKALSNSSQTTLPIRKEKAEIEGLQATIEKLKLDYENTTKKWKANKNRLYSLIKDHTIHIESNEKQLLCLEQEKLLLLEFISDQGLRLPKQLRSLLQKNPLPRSNNIDSSSNNSKVISNNKKNSKVIVSSSSNSNQTNNSVYEMEINGYAEEIDVDDLDITSTTIKVHEETSDQQAVEYDFYDNYNSNYNNNNNNNNNSHNNNHSIKSLSVVQISNNISAKDNLNLIKGVSSNRYSYNNNNNIDEDEPFMNTTTTNNSNTLFNSNTYVNDSINKNRNSLSNSNSIKYLSQSILPPTPVKHEKSFESTNHKNINNISNHNHTDNNNNNQNQNDNQNNINTNRIEEILPNGKRIIKYKNGTQKEIDIEGNTIVRFLNGDSKRSEIKTGIIIYYYALADTRHTTYPDGLEVYEFPNKQLEKHFPNGMKEIIFPDTTRKVITTDGIQECYFPDGVVLREYADGRKAIISNNM